MVHTKISIFLLILVPHHVSIFFTQPTSIMFRKVYRLKVDIKMFYLDVEDGDLNDFFWQDIKVYGGAD